MDHTICPGSKALREPTPDLFPCPSCGTEVEIWSDEVRGTCPACKRTIIRDGFSSCLDWCKMGKECVGAEIYDSYMEKRAAGISRQLLLEMEAFFGSDTKRIAHARSVLRFAEEILEKEGHGNGDWHIVIPAGILHDVGIKIAEEKYNSSAGHLQEKEGPAVARKILLKIGLKKEDIDEICEIIAHHHSPGKIDTQNFRILYDADCLENMREVLTGESPGVSKEMIEELFLTRSGREIAKRLFLK